MINTALTLALICKKSDTHTVKEYLRPNQCIHRILPWFEVINPKGEDKFCIYQGFGRGYSYSNMTYCFKMNNYYKFYGKRVIVMTAIMSDNSNPPGYADFTHKIFL